MICTDSSRSSDDSASATNTGESAPPHNAGTLGSHPLVRRTPSDLRCDALRGAPRPAFAMLAVAAGALAVGRCSNTCSIQQPAAAVATELATEHARGCAAVSAAPSCAPD